MSDSLVYKTRRPWPNKRLKIAAIVGHTTSSSSRIWVRTGGLKKFCLIVYPVDGAKKLKIVDLLANVPFDLRRVPNLIKQYPFTVSDYSKDTIHVVDVEGLKPGTCYGYALWGHDAGGGKATERILLGQDRPLSFRTFPDRDKPFTFAFFSCHMPYEETLFGRTRIVNMGTWEALHRALARHANDDLRFIIAAGDQVYADGVPTLDIWELLRHRMRKSGAKLLPSQRDMVSWYRDIYRGYWGFNQLQEVFSSYPTYMIWDDHEICDGWGSFKAREIKRIIPKRSGWTDKDRRTLANRMFMAARQVYDEYEHSHNPATKRGQFDYGFHCGQTAFYVLDGRGQRDLNMATYKILGRPQFKRFVAWLQELTPSDTKYLFVVSAVPLLHLRAIAADLASLAKSLQDDLRDSWDHKTHDVERKALTEALFAVANRGIRVSVLSGDVHTAAAFRIEHNKSGQVIYQLTSSAITYNVPRTTGWLLAAAAAGRGKTRDGHSFERVALYHRSNFAMVHVDAARNRAEFRLYGQGQFDDSEATDHNIPASTSSQASWQDRVWEDPPGAHSIATIPLEFQQHDSQGR